MRKTESEAEIGKKVHDFIAQNHSTLEREWKNVSTYSLVRELRNRGWKGIIYNEDPNIPEEHKHGVITVFHNGGWLPEEDEK